MNTINWNLQKQLSLRTLFNCHMSKRNAETRQTAKSFVGFLSQINNRWRRLAVFTKGFSPVEAKSIKTSVIDSKQTNEEHSESI